jgi:hypothetical protein
LCAEDLLNEVVGCRLILKKDRLKVAKKQNVTVPKWRQFAGSFFHFRRHGDCWFSECLTSRAATLILD